MMGDGWARKKGRKTLLAVFDFLKLNKERKERFFELSQRNSRSKIHYKLKNKLLIKFDAI